MVAATRRRRDALAEVVRLRYGWAVLRLHFTPMARGDAESHDPDVLYRARTGGRWRAWATLLGVALIGGGIALRWVVGDAPLGYLAPYVLGLPGLTLLWVAFWRRGRIVEVRRQGIRLGSGGTMFGERQLVPWTSIEWFGGRRQKDGTVCLVFRQQHVARDHPLPGKSIAEDEYHRLIDRLKVVLGDAFPRLRVGGLD